MRKSLHRVCLAGLALAILLLGGCAAGPRAAAALLFVAAESDDALVRRAVRIALDALPCSPNGWRHGKLGLSMAPFFARRALLETCGDRWYNGEKTQGG